MSWSVVQGSRWSYADRCAYIVMELVTKSKTQMELAKEFHCREQRISQIYIGLLEEIGATADTDPAVVGLKVRLYRSRHLAPDTPEAFYFYERFPRESYL